MGLEGQSVMYLRGIRTYMAPFLVEFKAFFKGYLESRNTTTR